MPWLDGQEADSAVLSVWAASRLSLFVVAAAGWLFLDAGDQIVPLFESFGRWDFVHYAGIAAYGYGGEPTGVPNEAFFPGLPALLWLLHNALGLPMVAAGLVVSLVAGGVAAVALGRLGDLEAGPGVGRLVVLVWVFAPPAVFLALPYTEALFLAFAIPAWLAAKRGRWMPAGLLAAAACTIRVSGVFLVAALVVEWATARERRDWAGLAWLAVPAAPLAAWMAYLRWLTGDWLAWLNAQAQEWHRELTWPWDAFANTWQAAGQVADPNFAWMFRVEILAVLVGVALTVALLRWRRWGEATWVGLQVAAFATSTVYFSVPRAMLLWWPLWITLAVMATRRRWVLWAYLAVSGPLMAVWAAAFLTGQWAG